MHRVSRRVVVAVAAASSLGLVLSACEPSSPSPTSSPSASSTAEPDVSLYESGPESPLGYGLEVPAGATQLGPLIRIRSPRLIEAYREQRETAEDERYDALVQQAEEDAEPGQTPPTPSPTPDPLPSNDTFNLLEDPPRPDTSLSVIRVDGDPTLVLRRMLAQVSALLPDADVPIEDVGSICKQSNQRVTGCRFQVRGMTAEKREVDVLITVDPGDVDTRTAPVASLRSPVMTLRVAYVGDPEAGQEQRESSDIGKVRDVEELPDPPELIWPRMDVDAPATSKLVGGFVPAADTKVLLSGFAPAFASLYVDKAYTADALARAWVTDLVDGEPAKDVVDDLNEVATTYTGTASNGTIYRATHVLSARGNYVLMFAYPRP